MKTTAPHERRGREGLQEERSGIRRTKERSYRSAALLDYGQFEGIDAACSLARLFAAARLHINFFQTSFRKKKHREGAKVMKRYLPPATPFEGALVHPSLNEAFKRRL
ncbi:hypothetical protein [Bradyrhizobium brasilense]|uniref:hypothetical protein n=1 Tax=Bradyrhizobium brasilense TaxID=1419277 RepID=UPI00116002CA|nr:hypothetical protein [Bradyrhizobium brasilense]